MKIATFWWYKLCSKRVEVLYHDANTPKEDFRDI
jgi:hypothetical protein